MPGAIEKLRGASVHAGESEEVAVVTAAAGSGSRRGSWEGPRGTEVLTREIVRTQECADVDLPVMVCSSRPLKTSMDY